MKSIIFALSYLISVDKRKYYNRKFKLIELMQFLIILFKFSLNLYSFNACLEFKIIIFINEKSNFGHLYFH